MNLVEDLLIMLEFQFEKVRYEFLTNDIKGHQQILHFTISKNIRRKV